jgi:hypothetical protein
MRVCGLRIVEKGEKHGTDHDVGHGQDYGCDAWLPGVGDDQRDNQQRGHRHGHTVANEAHVGAGLVGQPGVRRPGHPQQQQEDQPLRQGERGGRLRHQRDDLGKGKDEHQVEKDLEGGRPVRFVGQHRRRSEDIPHQKILAGDGPGRAG